MTWLGRSILVGAFLLTIVSVARARIAGAAGIHDPLLVAPRLTICDRHYNSGGLIRSRAEIDAGGGPLLLVDPGLFGFFAPCPGPDDHGNRPCTPDALPTPCATVVYVRLGEDAYAPYALSGGP